MVETVRRGKRHDGPRNQNWNKREVVYNSINEIIIDLNNFGALRAAAFQIAIAFKAIIVYMEKFVSLDLE